MTIHYLSKNNSILNHFVAQLRDINVQGDRMRFRKNLHRIGEVMAYEISKELQYAPQQVSTPLGTKETAFIKDEVVVCSILRAGLALHEGFLSFFDGAENGFISAYRHHPNNDDYFEIVAQYMAVPNLDGKTLILADPMLATGFSAGAVYKKVAEKFTPAQVHLAVVIAAPEGVKYLEQHLPGNVHLWVACLDSP
jgi:uracil phosphoribosyltransferase